MFKKIINKLKGKHPDKMSFQAGFDLTNMAIVTFRQGEKKFNFLLDTGSNACIIDRKVLDKITHTKYEQKTTVFGMEGHTMEVEACTITLYFNDRGYTFDYLVNDMSGVFGKIKKESGVTLHGILGSCFFNKFKYVLDFDELIAYSKQ